MNGTRTHTFVPAIVLAVSTVSATVNAAERPANNSPAAVAGRLEQLERKIEEQAREIQELKAQISQQQPPEVSPAQVQALQNQVNQVQETIKATATPPDKKIRFKGISLQ